MPIAMQASFSVYVRADFVAIDASSLGAAMADAPMSRRVFKAGKLVGAVDQSSVVYKGS